MASALISFRDPGVEQQLTKRTGETESPSLVAKRDLERYYWLLQQAQQELVLHTSELNLICDALNGTDFSEAWTIPGIVHEVQDAIALRALDQKRGCDGEKLVERLSVLSPIHLVALVDRVEQFWRKA